MNFAGLKDLLDSERGVYALIVTMIATAMQYTERMTVDQWMTFTIAIGSGLMLSKTVTTGLEIVKRQPPPTTTATVVVATAPAAPIAPAPPAPSS